MKVHGIAQYVTHKNAKDRSSWLFTKEYRKQRLAQVLEVKNEQTSNRLAMLLLSDS